MRDLYLYPVRDWPQGQKMYWDEDKNLHASSDDWDRACRAQSRAIIADKIKAREALKDENQHGHSQA